MAETQTLIGTVSK